MNSSGPAWIANARAPRAVLIGLGLSLLLATAAGYADGTVYKWTDSQGRVHYSDRPPADGEAKAIAVNTGYSHTTPKAADSSPARTPTRPADANTTAPASSVEKKVAADLAVAHEGDCKRAKATYETYIRVRHLYKAGDEANPGDRQFLSDAELEQARVDARREMDEACGSGQ